MNVEEIKINILNDSFRVVDVMNIIIEMNCWKSYQEREVAWHMALAIMSTKRTMKERLKSFREFIVNVKDLDKMKSEVDEKCVELETKKDIQNLSNILLEKYHKDVFVWMRDDFGEEEAKQLVCDTILQLHQKYLS